MHAEEAVTELYLHQVPYYMDSPENGTYVDLMQGFTEQFGHQFDVKMASSERIEKLLVLGVKEFCSLGFSVELAASEGLPTGHLVESQSFNRIHSSILSHKNIPINHVDNLHQRALVVYHGNVKDAEERLPEGVEVSIVTVSSLDALIKVVINQRVDAGFVTSPDILMSPYFQQEQSQLHLVDLPNSNRRESLVCFNSPKLRLLVKRFDQYIEALRQSDELKQYIEYKAR